MERVTISGFSTDGFDTLMSKMVEGFSNVLIFCEVSTSLSVSSRFTYLIEESSEPMIRKLLTLHKP